MWDELVDDRRGVIAVEFALVGLLALLVICFVTELGLTVVMEESLDEAARFASRFIRTGQIQAAGSLPGTFSNKLCSKLSTFMTCSAVKFNVVSGNTFAALPATIKIDSNNQMTGTQFSPGTAGQDVVIQVAYTRQIYFPILSQILGNNGMVLISTTVAFQNEPY